MDKNVSKKVFVAISGGVDSSVAALLLRDEGYDVTGVFMYCYNLDGCVQRDAIDARRVASELKIPFYVWDFEKEYKKRVVNYMIDGYKRGITPNPDVMCNKEIKFGLFLEKALSMGADFVATGHYIRLRRNFQFPISNFQTNSKFKIQNSKFTLWQAKDSNKDQSYFLWTLTQSQLKHCLFPIGDYLKSEVREMARKAKLLTAEKKDSQGICFLGKVTLSDFLKEYISSKPGAILTEGGKKIGEHKGVEFYTIGQRHVGVGGLPSPHYVAAKDMETNTLVVAEGSDNSALYKNEAELTDVNFINPNTPFLIRANKKIDVLARVRYRQPLAKATLYRTPSTSSGFRIVFDNPQKFVAPGQSAVFYSQEGNPSIHSGRNFGEFRMLGGGVIMK